MHERAVVVKLAGKIALITGAGRGIGKGCALELARAGADVVINDRPGSPDLAAAAEEVRALGRRCWTIEADVFDRAGCESLVEGALAAAGRIDVLVSNPAAGRRCEFLQLPPEEFERIIRGALSSGFHMSQLVARSMVKRGAGGGIIFISSVQARNPYALSVAYNAAKAGLNHLAETIAVELSPYRIRVNVIEPGWIDTPGEREAFGSEKMAQAAAQLPWGRLGSPADIGKAAAYLASDDADYVTGAALRVDGGFLFKDCRADTIIRPAD